MDNVFDTLDSWRNSFLKLVPNFFAAVLIIIVTIIVARLVRGAIRKIVSRTSDSKTMVQLLSTLSYLLTLIFGLIIALNVL